MPILADDVVRYVGEKVAAVAAESEDGAEQAMNLIEIEYEEMEPLFDPSKAIQPTRHSFTRPLWPTVGYLETWRRRAIFSFTCPGEREISRPASDSRT